MENIYILHQSDSYRNTFTNQPLFFHLRWNHPFLCQKNDQLSPFLRMIVRQKLLTNFVNFFWSFSLKLLFKNLLQYLFFNFHNIYKSSIDKLQSVYETEISIPQLFRKEESHCSIVLFSAHFHLI